MAVTDRTVDDENAEVIHGRQDFGNRGFGVTLAKKHPPYVFSIRGVSCLVHKIARVELHWYRCAGHGEKLVRLKRPVAIAICHCSFFARLLAAHSRTCYVPNPEAILCGRCHGDTAPFGKYGFATALGMKRQEAHVKLGCVVKGY